MPKKQPKAETTRAPSTLKDDNRDPLEEFKKLSPGTQRILGMVLSGKIEAPWSEVEKFMERKQQRDRALAAKSPVKRRSFPQLVEPGVPTTTYAEYLPAEPYFLLVRRALGDLVDGEHFFDTVTEDTVYEVLYDLGGWPRIIRGRAALMAAFKGYVKGIALRAADHLLIHATEGGQVVVIEYEVHGTMLKTGAAYDNRFCSIIRIEQRKIAHWRDYMDSLAAWNAMTAKGPQEVRR